MNQSNFMSIDDASDGQKPLLQNDWSVNNHSEARDSLPFSGATNKLGTNWINQDRLADHSEYTNLQDEGSSDEETKEHDNETHGRLWRQVSQRKDSYDTRLSRSKTAVFPSMSFSSNLNMAEFHGSEYHKRAEKAYIAFEHMSESDRRHIKRPRGKTRFRAVVHAVILCYRLCREYEKRTESVMNGRSVTIASYKSKQNRTCRVFLNPRSKRIAIWNYLVLITMIYYIFFVPYIWYQQLLTTAWKVLDTALDITIILDIIRSFMTGIVMDTYVLEDYREIAKGYLGNYFFFDLIAVLPFYVIDEHLYLLKVFRLVRLKDGYAMFKSKLIGNSTSMSFLNFTGALFVFCAILSYTAAIFLYFGSQSMDENSWFHDFDDLPTKYERQVGLYVLSSFYVVNTVTTVGLLGLDLDNNGEKLIIMSYQFLGIILTALLHGRFVHMLRMRRAENYAQVQNDNFNQWLLMILKRRHKFRTDIEQTAPLPPGSERMLKKIEDFALFTNAYSYKQLTSENEFFERMPTEYQIKLSLSAFGAIVRRFSSFFDLFKEESFKMEIISGLRPKMFQDNEVIFSANTQPKGLYFFYKSNGIIKHQYTDIFRANDGLFLGETFILNMDSMIDLVSVEETTHCFYIPKAEVIDICSRHPASLSVLETVAFKRIEFFREIIARLDYEASIMMNSSLIINNAVSLQNDGLQVATRNNNPSDIDLMSNHYSFLPKLSNKKAESSFSELVDLARIHHYSSRRRLSSSADNQEAASKQKEEQDDDEEGDDSDSDVDNKDLNGSFECPIEDDSLDYNKIQEADNITDHLEDRITSLGLRIRRLRRLTEQDLNKEVDKIINVIQKNTLTRRNSQRPSVRMTRSQTVELVL